MVFLYLFPPSCQLVMKRIFIVSIVAFLPLLLVGQTHRTSSTTGSLWFDGGAGWSLGVPLATSTVFFDNSSEATIKTGESAIIAIFVGNNSNTLTIELGGSLTVNGAFVTENQTTLKIFGNLILNGDLTVNNNLTLIVSGLVTINGGVDFGSSGNLTVTNTGVLNILGDVTATNSTNLVVNGSMNVGGNITVGNSSTLTGTGSILLGGVCNDNGSPSFCEAGPLPIFLLYFKGEQLDRSIRLSWSTASEINFDYFDLEKSSNGKDFSSIAHVTGNGTTNKIHDYSFEDNLPIIGTNYYRLTSVDFDNYKQTFKVIMQDYSGEKEFQVSPNPSNGQTITLNFNFDSSDGHVAIYNNIGSIIDSFQINETGHITFTNILKDGIYFAKYSSPSFTKAIRFLVRQ
jgi:hypothetical protein